MQSDKKHCVPCEGIGRAFTPDEALANLKKIPGWTINADKAVISRQFKMKNFMAAVKLIDTIAIIAEEENHHPDIQLTGYRNLRIELSTHALKGLTENDFILAEMINALPLDLKI